MTLDWARVFLNKEQAEKVEEYYRLCADEGATPEEYCQKQSCHVKYGGDYR